MKNSFFRSKTFQFFVFLLITNIALWLATILINQEKNYVAKSILFFISIIASMILLISIIAIIKENIVNKKNDDNIKKPEKQNLNNDGNNTNPEKPNLIKIDENTLKIIQGPLGVLNEFLSQTKIFFKKENSSNQENKTLREFHEKLNEEIKLKIFNDLNINNEEVYKFNIIIKTINNILEKNGISIMTFENLSLYISIYIKNKLQEKNDDGISMNDKIKEKKINIDDLNNGYKKIFNNAKIENIIWNYITEVVHKNDNKVTLLTSITKEFADMNLDKNNNSDNIVNIEYIISQNITKKSEKNDYNYNLKIISIQDSKILNSV